MERLPVLPSPPATRPMNAPAWHGRTEAVQFQLEMEPEHTTEELKALAQEREAAEEELAESAVNDTEAAQHSRRAEKTRYLRQKLEEREKSEREAEEER